MLMIITQGDVCDKSLTPSLASKNSSETVCEGGDNICDKPK